MCTKARSMVFTTTRHRAMTKLRRNSHGSVHSTSSINTCARRPCASQPEGTIEMAAAKTNTAADLSLRHAVATLAYRAAKVLRGAPPEFSTFRAGEGSRPAGLILSHLCD